MIVLPGNYQRTHSMAWYQCVQQRRQRPHNRRQAWSCRVGYPAEIIYLEQFKTGRSKWTPVFLETGQIVCQLLFGQPVLYGAAKSRKLVIHVDYYTHTAVNQKVINLFRAILVSLKADAVTD